MSFALNRYISAASSGLAFLAFTQCGAQSATCPTTLIDRIGANSYRQLKDAAIAHAIEMHGTARLAPPPRELAHSVRENLPNIIRNLWLTPVEHNRGVIVDMYLGQELRSSPPEVLVLPRDFRVVCTLLPYEKVLLSDGVTHHYALIGDVDHARRTIVLLDQWANVSFLREGRNLAGVKATASTGIFGTGQLKLSFEEIQRVIRGRFSSARPFSDVPATLAFDTIADLYPELAETEGFQAWKYSRLLSGFDIKTNVEAARELATRTDLGDKPILQSFAAGSSDLLMGVLSNFGTVLDFRTNQVLDIDPAADPAAQQAMQEQRRNAFLASLERYASTFTWSMRWRLLHSSQLARDPQLALAVAERLVAKAPHDIDFRIAKARALLALGETEQTAAELRLARKQWEDDVASVIAVDSRAKAVAYFFEIAPTYGLVTFAHLYRQLAQIDLLAAIVEARRDAGANAGALLERAVARYRPAGNRRGAGFDFLSEALWLMWQAGSVKGESELLRQAIRQARTGDEQQHVAEAVFEHARTRRSIKGLADAVGDDLRRQWLRERVCAQLAGGPRLIFVEDGETKARISDLEAFCG